MAKIDYIVSGKTLLEIDKALELQQRLEKERNYLGASQIADPCWRKLFYSFRGACKREISAKGIRAIQDGFLQEKVMAERLRMVPGIQLYTEDADGNQISFSMFGGFFRGSVDGMILNPIEGSATEFEIWEHKSVNESKFNDLCKLIREMGEKKALEQWDETYHGQGIIYVDAFQKKRHFLTVTTPGGRDYTSCRTEASITKANILKDKAQQIIFDNFNIPAKLSEKREFYKCSWCHFRGICHDGDIPDINCKTCRYRDCDMQSGNFMCLNTNTVIEDSLLNVGCKDHIYNPALMPGCTLVEHQEDGCVYHIPEKDFFFSNTNAGGFPLVKDRIDAIYTSKELKENVKNINNLGEAMSKVQKAFQGEVDPKNSLAKPWDKLSNDKSRLIDL